MLTLGQSWDSLSALFLRGRKGYCDANVNRLREAAHEKRTKTAVPSCHGSGMANRLNTKSD